MKNSITLLCVWATVLLLAGCDVKDPIYNTPHPDKGQITLTTDWTRRTTGVDIPANYTVASGEYMATVSDATNTLDRLFERLAVDCLANIFSLGRIHDVLQLARAAFHDFLAQFVKILHYGTSRKYFHSSIFRPAPPVTGGQR